MLFAVLSVIILAGLFLLVIHLPNKRYIRSPWQIQWYLFRSYVNRNVIGKSPYQTVTLVLSTLVGLIGWQCLQADDDIIMLDPMVITTPLYKRSSKIAHPVNILSGDDLHLKAANTLGETLSELPGIANASFGPGVGRPVIRGQGGPRVRIQQGGTGSHDVSSLSPDHAVSIEPLLADRIEILRGPATLLYGNAAIGGVVNVIDNRIPETLLVQPKISIEQRFDTVSDQYSSVGRIDAAVGPVAIHLDGFYRDKNDTDINGSAIDQSNTTGFTSRGFIANSNSRAKSGTVGASLVGSNGYFGLATNYLKNDYGIPSRPPEAGEEIEKVRINLSQSRYDIETTWNLPWLFVTELKGHITYNDYQHKEIEDGVEGTVFENEAYEGRFELEHSPIINGNQGVWGVQLVSTDFSALGEEAFIPVTETRSYGLFLLEDLQKEDWIFEAGVRVESSHQKPKTGKARDFTPISASISALWQFSTSSDIGVVLSRSQRAPELEELYSMGVHLATQSFEQGDQTLRKETSYNVDFSFDSDLGWLSISANLFYNQIDDYVLLANTGQVFNLDSEMIESVCSGTSCLPVRQYGQMDATFKGYEIEANLPFFDSGRWNFDVDLFSDYVRGKIDGAGNVPRMPPLRYGFQLNMDVQSVQANLRFTRAEKQTKPGRNESQTDDYLLLSAGITYRLGFGKGRESLFYIKGNNLLDQEIRNSTSFLRDFAPEQGRGIEFGIRLSF